jgi:putative Ca2+/H+ antiporter (TMEM165/GDT1 family)
MESLPVSPALGALTAVFTTFGLIFLAEIGDKSQLVCMTLAARHRHFPVLLGAIAAFIILNTLAVVFGAGLAQWVPEKVLAGAVALLFGAFGIKSLLTKEEKEEEGEVEEKPGHGIFVTTFLMILLAEMGDKTQIAIAGLASTLPAAAVWLGATLALLVSCVGRKLVMGDRVDEELDAVAAVLGQGAVLTGFYSNGEISPGVVVGDCHLHNQTMTVTTLSEV